MEIDLPSKDELGSISNRPPSSDDNEDTKVHTSPTSEKSISDSLFKTPNSLPLNDSSPIIYHYLTFETTLPQPCINSQATSPPPPFPDLKKFTSPFEWSKSRKNFIMAISCIATMVTAYTAGSYASASSQMISEWHVSDVAIEVGITTFCTGFGVAPMVLAPFSEINGRYPVFVGAGILFLICQICCAVTRSYAGMIVARFWVGAGSSVFSTMVGGVVSDMYHAETRNTPMALFSGVALFGTGLGPLVSGFIAQNTDWRWVFWVQVITCGLLVAAVTIFFQETRGSILLSRKSGVLNQYYTSLESAGHFGVLLSPSPSSNPSDKSELSPQRIRWRVKSDEERESIAKMISISVYRPFHLLVTEPVVFFFSLWVSFAWAVLYLTFGSIPLVFSTSHDFSLQQSGAVFTALCVGATLATILSICQDHWLASYLSSIKDDEKKSNWLSRNLDLSKPESRLYFTCIESFLLPIGLFWFGWSSFPQTHWIVPTLAIGCATMGIYSIYLAGFNYLADTYHRYASSAIAAQSFCRNILGGVFPLVTVQMFKGLTFQGAASLLGGIAVLLSTVPWVLCFYGTTIRARSRFASEIM